MVTNHQTLITRAQSPSPGSGWLHLSIYALTERVGGGSLPSTSTINRREYGACDPSAHQLLVQTNRGNMASKSV